MSGRVGQVELVNGIKTQLEVACRLNMGRTNKIIIEALFSESKLLLPKFECFYICIVCKKV